ncbi:hypothetical protein HUG20_15945 [Salicibibacter cibi]|uniref:Uncharacterized protein n=1 Tax=Salicibibacter cibi TaxID=2743001 RepID=A0A7T6ZD12_9BACI|nr:hypothetical protein [Salicibibacter cibi]QQK81249.1 hypothetical protein HUG20_15945 [Salicibibacter cibi]
MNTGTFYVLSLMISFGALVAFIMSKKNNKNNPSYALAGVKGLFLL